MYHNRRQFFLTGLGLALAARLSRLVQHKSKADGTKIILLGTKGGPRVATQGRKNTSVLLLINDTPYVIDCGYGTTLQLLTAGVALNKLKYIFITHHHSDHNLEYGPLIYNCWVTGLPIHIDAYGPKGLKDMTRSFFDYMKTDIDVRIEDEGRPDLRNFIFPHDIISPGIILKNEEVTVTAATVRHPMIKQAYAFRFDTKDRSVVISGDTAYSPELIELAKGADVLLHEIMYLPGLEGLLSRVPNAARFKEHLLVSHSTPEDVGKVAAAAGVKKLVLYHFVPPDDNTITDEQWTAGIREHYKGEIIVGKDMMQI